MVKNVNNKNKKFGGLVLPVPSRVEGSRAEGFTPTPIVDKSAMRINSSNPQLVWGFTMIELLISMAILVIIASVGFVYLGGYRRTADIDATLQKMVSFTREAQMRAKSGQDGMVWGVHWENPSAGEDFYSLFKNIYNATNTVETIKLGSGVKFTDPTTGNYDEVIFQRITGNPNVTTTSVTISSKVNESITKTITVNALGQIDY